MSRIYSDFTFDLSRLDKKMGDMIKMVDGEIEAFGYDVVRDAKLATPVNLGVLRNTIFNDYAAGRTTITVAADYAAYVEFGTGEFAASYVSSLPKELQEYAITFFKTGKGRLPARPFLFPAYFKNLGLLKARLKAYERQ